MESITMESITMEFIKQWLHKKAGKLMDFSLIHLSGPVGTCKSTLARLIALIHKVSVLLVDELGGNQNFYLILVDGTKKLLTPESVLEIDNFKVVVANCGTMLVNNPQEDGTFPSVKAIQKLGEAVGTKIASKIKTAIEADAFKKVEMWKLLEALMVKFGVAEARKIWINMVFPRPDNSYVRFKTRNGPLNLSQQALSLFADWGKGFQPWNKIVWPLMGYKISVSTKQKPETKYFAQGYFYKGEYSLGEPPVGVKLTEWNGLQMLPVPKNGDVQEGRGVSHITLGENLPFVELLKFEYQVALTNSAGEVVGTADYALADGNGYHMTTMASGIPPTFLGHPLVKDALKEFALQETSSGGVKTD